MVKELCQRLDPEKVYLEGFIALQVFAKLFRISRLPHKSVHVSFTITNVKNKLANVRGNCL